MKTKYWNKGKLYKEVDKLKYELGLELTYDMHPIDSKSLAYKHCKNLIIEEIPFPSLYICGILYKDNEKSSIALNSNREINQQNKVIQNRISSLEAEIMWYSNFLVQFRTYS